VQAKIVRQRAQVKDFISGKKAGGEERSNHDCNDSPQSQPPSKHKHPFIIVLTQPDDLEPIYQWQRANKYPEQGSLYEGITK
jgi:hypothetical protein